MLMYFHLRDLYVWSAKTIQSKSYRTVKSMGSWELAANLYWKDFTFWIIRPWLKLKKTLCVDFALDTVGNPVALVVYLICCIIKTYVI